MTSPSLPHVADGLLDEAVATVTDAAAVLRDRYTRHPAVALDDIVAEIHANDAVVLDVLKSSLLAARPGSRWAKDELAYACSGLWLSSSLASRE
ncbi:hypothetical protein [Streptomyces hokutonensis]|uniref:Uncharacterized protein n=1 Tax=Streptomyces hokutonensis TaxID=1306990 RepID=A0ABW6MGG9_9ACTN